MPKGFRHSEETKKALSLAKKGDRNPAKRADVKAKISQTLIKRHRKTQSWARKRYRTRRRLLKQLRTSDFPAYEALLHRIRSQKTKKEWRNKEVRNRRKIGFKAAWKRSHDKRCRLVFTKEYRRRHAIISRKRDCSGRIAHRKRKYWYKGVNGRIAMRSAWEVQYAKALDLNKIKWLYEPVTFILRNGKRSWTPDFFLPGLNKFVEIKGWFLPRVREKIREVITHFKATKFSIQRHCEFELHGKQYAF